MWVLLIVAAIFAAWFGRVAQHAGRDALPWAAGGAALFLVAHQLLMMLLAAIVDWTGIEGGGILALLVAAWIASVVVTAAIGVRILPDRSHDALQLEIAMQEAKAAKSGEDEAEERLRCERCGRELTRREALMQGAIRIDDATCVCAACKRAP